MNFRVVQRYDLENARSPFRITQRNGREVEWVNRFLHQQRVRSVAEATLRSYAYDCAPRAQRAERAQCV